LINKVHGGLRGTVRLGIMQREPSLCIPRLITEFVRIILMSTWNCIEAAAPFMPGICVRGGSTSPSWHWRV
jgi:hypothetical protein